MEGYALGPQEFRVDWVVVFALASNHHRSIRVKCPSTGPANCVVVADHLQIEHMLIQRLLNGNVAYHLAVKY